KKLEIPGGSRQGTEKIVSKHWRPKCTRSRAHKNCGGSHLLTGSVRRGFKNVLLIPSRYTSSNLGMEILITSSISVVQDEAPDKICCESTSEKHDQNGKALPQGRSTVLKRYRFNGITGR